MTGLSVFNLVVSSAGFALGSVFLKRYADAGQWFDLGSAFLILGLSNMVYIQLMAKGLAQAAAISSMAHLVLMGLASVLLFGERLGQYHIVGMMLAMVTIWVFSLAPQTSG